MNRTFLSTFMKCTCAALNGLGASTAPDTAAVPAICAASCALAGAIAVVPPSIVNPIVNSAAKSRRLVRMATLLLSDAGLGGRRHARTPCRGGQYGRERRVVNDSPRGGTIRMRSRPLQLHVLQ